jgi:hypothetical protein
MKKIIYTFTLTCTLISCQNFKSNTGNQEQETNKIIETEQLLIGKSGKITFPEMTAEVKYVNDSTLHWKTIDNKGRVAEGDEKMDYQKLTDHLHFLNWIEKDGWTVSQIIDTKKGTVKAYWSFADEKSTHGKRSSMFVDGKFEFVK